MSGASSGADAVADEGDWYAALVAGEHVGDWLDVIKVRPPQRKNALPRFVVTYIKKKEQQCPPVLKAP